MKEPRDLRELVGEDVPADEFERLREVDRLLRQVPAPPPDVPQSLTHAVATVARRPSLLARRRQLALALAAALALAVLAFGLGRWTADDEFEAAWAVELRPTAEGGAASGLVRVAERDENGNVALELDVSGLAPLAEDEFYALWLEKDGEWAATCGYFAVGEGETTVRMTVSYDIRDFDAWVISAGGLRDEPPPLLAAEIEAA